MSTITGPLIGDTKGTVAVYTGPIPGPYDYGDHEYRVPVIAWDAAGYALVPSAIAGSDQLVRAADRLKGMDRAWKFKGLDCPDDDDVAVSGVA